MITFQRVFLAGCILLSASMGFSQQRVFSPQLWLSNPKEMQSFKEDANNLNSYGNLVVDSQTLNSSVNKVDDNNHLFLVYRSEAPENIISILSRNKSLFLNSDRVKINDSITVSGYNENHGELLDVRFGGMDQGRFWMNPRLESTKIYELILVNGNSNFSVNEIRTYLSLKYGIDLIDPKQYEYNKQQLWDSSDKKYNNHIFGIAKLSSFSLRPNETVHSKDQDLHILINSENKKKLKDGNFILFGHNNKSLTFNKATKHSNKTWLAQTNMDYVKVDLAFPASKFQNVNAQYQLIVGENENTRTYNGTMRGALYVFRNVSFSKDAPVVLKLSETTSNIELDVTNTCKDFIVKLKPGSAARSFLMKIKDDKSNVVYSSKSVSSVFSATDVSSKYYDIQMNYDGQVLERRIFSYNSTLDASGLKKTYRLEGGTLQITLSAANDKQFEWYKGQVKIGAGNSIQLDSAGDYSMKVSAEGGCSAEHKFAVLLSDAYGQWSAYPNPLEVNEDLNVSFDLESKKTVDLVIYTIDGKLVKKVSLGEIQNKTVSLGPIAGSSGTYMLVAYIDNVPQIQKIILK